MANAPRVIVFAGPNGAGKTTHAELILAPLGISTFVNADFIARGLSGRDTRAVDFEAGRLMLARLRHLSTARQDFAFESTLSSRTFAPFLVRLKLAGYRVSIFYFALSSAVLAVQRVRLRVRLGGHQVPEDAIRRRFNRSLLNLFELYQPLADEWTVFDNSAAGAGRLVATHNQGHTEIDDAALWARLQHQLKRAHRLR